MNIKIKKSLEKNQNILFLILIAFGAVFLFWKAQYGYIFNDEPFILTLGHRLLKGDKLFINEWNGTQLCAFFNYPIIKLYSLIKKPVFELVLFVRIIYVIWWIFVSCIIYRRFKQFGLISIAAMSYFMLFTPLDTMSITYNAMALSFFCLFATYFLAKGNKFTDILAGVALALGGIASPYSVVLYLAYALAVIIINITKLKNKPFASAKIFDLKVFINITIGASLVGIAFLAYLYWVGFDNVFNSFEMIFMYRNLPFAGKFISIIKTLVIQYPIQTIFGMLLIVLSAVDKKKYERRFIYFLIQTVFWGITIALIMLRLFSGTLNVIMLPITVLGLQAFILTKNKNIEVFLSLWVTGILFAIISNESSDTGIFAISMASTVSGIGSLLLISFFAKEFECEKSVIRRLVTFGLAAIVCVQLGSQLITRGLRTYWDAPLPKLNTKISVGVAKGIITTKEHALKYEEVYDDIMSIKQKASPDEKVLIASLFPSAYLDLDMNYATYSSWTYIKNRNNFEGFIERLSQYYEENKEKLPQYIYVTNENADNVHLLEKALNLSDYIRTDGKQGIIFEKSN